MITTGTEISTRCSFHTPLLISQTMSTQDVDAILHITILSKSKCYCFILNPICSFQLHLLDSCLISCHDNNFILAKTIASKQLIIIHTNYNGGQNQKQIRIYYLTCTLGIITCVQKHSVSFCFKI